jgi:DNA-binding LacI/PurR family transcriptional regulator
MTSILSDNPSQTKHATISHELRERIMRGELGPGDRLPSFSEFKAQYGIAPSTIEKIVSTLENEGLVERFHGKGVFVTQKQNSLKRLGFFCRQGNSASWSLYWSHLMEGLQEGAHARGYDILLLSPESQDALHEKVDGVILHELHHAGYATMQLPRARVSVVSPLPGTASVVSDDYSGMYEAMKHLLAQGHRRIAFLMGNAPWPMQTRLAAYHAALGEAGIRADPEWVHIFSGMDFREIGRIYMRDWLHTFWRELGCTALICNNDDVALGVMDELQTQGLRVPEDVSVIGYDGTILCETAHPKLTSVKVPLREIGFRAAGVLIEQIETGKIEQISLSLPTQLQVRGTTCRPAS